LSQLLLLSSRYQYSVTIIRQEKRLDQRMLHAFLNFDDMMHTNRTVEPERKQFWMAGSGAKKF